MDTYEKKYKEIVGLIKKAYLYAQTNSTKAVLEEIFPELKESEDERIRKVLIKLFETENFNGYVTLDGIDIDDVLAWLEKQGKQKPVDKIEPKFKVGDWVVYTGYLLKDSGKEIYVMKVASVEDDSYNFTDTSILCFDSEKDMRLWTIQDARDGDVLASELCDSIILFKGIKDGNIDFYCDYDFSKIDIPGDRFAVNNGQHYGNVEDSKDFHPATKEQRDLLFQKMKEAGYEWDAEKKELKKIEQKSQRMISAEAKEAMYDKPAWSEEDELVIKDIEEAITNYWHGQSQEDLLDRLKSLKQRIGG